MTLISFLSREKNKKTKKNKKLQINYEEKQRYEKKIPLSDVELPGAFLWDQPPVLPPIPTPPPGPPSRAELQPPKTTLSAAGGSTETTGNTDHTTAPSESLALPQEGGWRPRPPPAAVGQGVGSPVPVPASSPRPEPVPRGRAVNGGSEPSRR